MSSLESLQVAETVSLRLDTLTPLYTGGVGQHGDQIHPSGILGGIRRFSCLLAAAVGDASFEHQTWGTDANEEAGRRHAKRVAVRVDPSGLRPVTLPGRINWPRGDEQKRNGWFYNVAHEGVLGLAFTRRGISDPHWQLLLLALRIQIRHATFGSRDQFGLGVLATDALPTVAPLRGVVGPPLDRPGLHRAFFASVRLDTALPQDHRVRLEQGLRWREHLRHALRQPGQDELRHYVFGQLNRQGNAVNVSALYASGGQCSLRVWGVLPHTLPARFTSERPMIMQALRQALMTGPQQTLQTTRKPHWDDAADHAAHLVDWINRLAGMCR